MKIYKYIMLVGCLFLATSCSTTSLYYWGGVSQNVSKYEALAYKTYDQQTPQSICQLLCVYEDMVSSAKLGGRQVPPPGICAEYGYLLLLPETVNMVEKNASKQQLKILVDPQKDLRQQFQERGKMLLEMEMTLYPESTSFIMPILKKMTN